MMHRLLQRVATAALLGGSLAGGILAGAGPSATPGRDWPRFRGPNGQGRAASGSLPDSLQAGDIVWRAELPGPGHSSPVVQDQRVFVTAHDASASACLLICLDAADGSELWVQPLPVESYGMHDLNSYASTTPTVDETRVALTWTSGENLHAAAFDHAGEPLWRTALGRSAAQHGGGTSPVLFEGVLLVANDTEGAESFLAGLDARDGKVLWKRERSTSRASFASPLVFEPEDGPPEALFASTAHGVTSLDPHTGALRWEREGLFRPRCVASPALGGTILFASAGTGGGGKVGVALDLGRRGEAGVPVEAYRVKHGLPYVPTPLATAERLYLWSDGGIVSSLDMATGEEIWSERAEGTYYGSPILADGKLLALSTSGELVVLSAGDTFEELGRLDLGETSHATPAVAGGRLYLRTERHVVALGGQRRTADDDARPGGASPGGD